MTSYPIDEIKITQKPPHNIYIRSYYVYDGI